MRKNKYLDDLFKANNIWAVDFNNKVRYNALHFHIINR